VTVATSTVGTSPLDRTNNFSIPLHNVFDLIAPRELPTTMPMLELVSPVAHDDVQNVEVTTLTQTSREVLENSSVTENTDLLLDSVEHNHMTLQELGESPKVSNVHGTHSSPLGREDIRPNGVGLTIQTPREGLEIPVVDEGLEPLQDGVEQNHVSPRELEKSPTGAREVVPRPFTDEHVDMQEAAIVPTKEIAVEVLVDSNLVSTPLVSDSDIHVDTAQEFVSLQRQEIHPSKNIQHGLDLWERVREYDARTAAEASEYPDKFMPVLTRNQKQKLKVQSVLSKQPTKSRTRDDTQQTDQ